MSIDRLRYLLQQYAADASTPEETRELFGWIKKSKDETLLKEEIKKLWSGHTNDKQLPDMDWDAIYTKITNTPNIGKRYAWARIAAAAVIIVLLSAGAYHISTNYNVKIAAVDAGQQFKSNEVAPGGKKAVLTLANGAQIILDSTGNGVLTQQGNVKIIKGDGGQLTYNSNGSSTLPEASEVLYNVISTPRGGQYQVILADGSKVWLNAASSLRFPTSFPGGERNVELTGEGYFEVAHNTAKPFKVSLRKSDGAEIEVLGTHFNVNAYDDETTIKTTLLEGSVKVSKGSSSKTIRPGEQAQMENIGQSKIIIRAIDVDAAIAWKNGRFIFHGDNIQSVMRQLARWYDLDVKYDGNVSDEEFVGVINRTRYVNISEILDMLEKTRTVSFAISGHNVTVMPFKK